MRRTAGSAASAGITGSQKLNSAVGDDAEQRGRERHADPDEREGHHHLDEPGAAGRQRAPRGDVAGRVGEDQRRRRDLGVVDLQRRPEAGDVAEPVEADADDAEPVQARRASAGSAA